MATVYLSPTGDDSRTYAQAQNPATPWATPGKVQTSANSGDTVVMAAGTYALAGVVWSKSFTIIGTALSNGFPTTILDGGGATFGANELWTSFNFGVVLTLSNLRFTNAIVSAGFVIGHYSGGEPGSVSLTNCVFDTIQFTGANAGIVGSVYGNITISMSRCVIYNVTSNADYSSNALIHQWCFSTNSATVTLINCVLHLPSGSHVSAFLVVSGAPDLTIKNCIFRGEASYPLILGTPGTVQYSYSCASGCTSIPSGTGVITSDPLFVDAANGNFNLRPTSSWTGPDVPKRRVPGGCLCAGGVPSTTGAAASGRHTRREIGVSRGRRPVRLYAFPG